MYGHQTKEQSCLAGMSGRKEVKRNRAGECKEIKTSQTACAECDNGWVASEENKGEE